MIDLLRERRTVRDYKIKPVEDETLYTILDTARWAPSAGNIQNWRFIIVRDPHKRQALATFCAEQMWLADAPVLVVMCSLTDKVKDMFGERGEAVYALQSTSAAIENILIAAWSFGVGSAWIGSFSEDDVRKLLQIPFEVEIHAIISLGYPKEVPTPPRRLHLGDITFFEKYGNRKADLEVFPLSKHIPKVQKTAQDVIQRILERKK